MKNILNWRDKYEENFEAFIGSLFHGVLEKCFINNLIMFIIILKIVCEFQKMAKI